MAVPGQSIDYSDSKVFGFLRSFIQVLSMNAVGSLYDLSLLGDLDMFTLVWVKNHLPFSFPFL